ncbi:MAG: hypothetical protein LUF02_02055 [Erysipelotrichaceae bacterium]|nr:hypothetical protein [Erysipelotrichaceae bacterium]
MLREFGMDEENIKLLHDYDWDLFKSERLFLTKQFTNNDVVNYFGTTMELPINDIEDVLLQLDNEELYEIMKKIDSETLEILYLKIQSYNNSEIAQLKLISEGKVRYRIKMLRKKIEKDD